MDLFAVGGDAVLRVGGDPVVAGAAGDLVPLPREAGRPGPEGGDGDPVVPRPADEEVHWRQGGVSSAVLLDEEPECCFPCDPYELIPDECFDDIHALVDFLTRYREFYGPGNQIWCDRKLNAVAVEKSNCRVAFRWPTVNGAV